ncbi:MAG: 4Fe-4S binding protein [Oscillospiraceae bacterium]|nr:4Fe-4S binding protein [Oscillospiraceae bacterium]
MKMKFNLDVEKCVACGACAVACMDQNDTDPAKGQTPYRRVGVLEPERGSGALRYLSIACMHCDDAPCIPACPVCCISKDERGMTVYDNTLCIGCRSCAMACPYGAPEYSENGRMNKCHGCTVRQQYGYAPACVQVCSTKALTLTPDEE